MRPKPVGNAPPEHPRRQPPSNTPPSPHWLYDLQHTLDKLVHLLPHLTILSPSKSSFVVSMHGLTNITLLTLVQTTETLLNRQTTRMKVRGLSVVS